MLYHAIARKYRPETFAQVVGQEHVTGTLRAALRHGKLSHAYLFSGPRGCGKTTVARLLAKALNCTEPHDGEPCGACATCRAIAAGTFMDVLEIDAASNTGVDNVRELRDMARLAPTGGASRVFIIDEVHMLSKGAFNALLKILEEPPSRVFFFFATTEPTKIPRTILSRCQRFDFRLLSRTQLIERMREICAAEDVTIDAEGLRVLAALAEGSMRDGLSLLDQAIAGGEGTVNEDVLSNLFGLIRSEAYIELSDAMRAADPARALQLVDRLAAEGQDLVVFARGLLTHFRNLLLLKIDPGLRDAVDWTAEQIERLQPNLDHFGEQDLLAMLDRAGLHYDRIHRSTQPRILLEAAVVEFCRWERRILLAELVERLHGLLAGAGPAAPQRGGGEGQRPSAPRADQGRADRAGDAATRPSAAPARDQTAPARASADLVDGWTDFVQAVMQHNPGLAACLMDGLPAIRSQDGVLTVAFPADHAFMLQRVEARRAELEPHLATCFGRRLKLELVMAVADAGTGAAGEQRETVRRRVAPTQQEQLAQQCASDPELGRLVDMVRGTPLPEMERERWEAKPGLPETAPSTPVPGAETERADAPAPASAAAPDAGSAAAPAAAPAAASADDRSPRGKRRPPQP
jgi:DNA polymerase-3 subunit gamma/tau